MKFLDDAESTAVDDLWYCLMEGYIKPEEMLVPEDAEKVEDARKVIQEFFDTAISKNLIEIV